MKIVFDFEDGNSITAKPEAIRLVNDAKGLALMFGSIELFRFNGVKAEIVQDQSDKVEIPS